MKFDEFTKKFEGPPPVTAPQKQQSVSQRILAIVKYVWSTIFWGIVFLLILLFLLLTGLRFLEGLLSGR